MRHTATLGVPPPADPQDRLQTRRFLRAMLFRSLVLSAALWMLVVVITDLPTWFLLIGGASMIALAADVLWLNLKIRKDERTASR